MCIWDGKMGKKINLIAQVGNNGCCMNCIGCSCLMPVLNWYNYKASFSLSLCLLFFLHNHISLCVWSLSTTCVFFRQLVLSNKVWYYKMLQCDQYCDNLSTFRRRNFDPLLPVDILKYKLNQYGLTGYGSSRWLTFLERNWMHTRLNII